MKLSIAMIVKNEEKNIERTLIPLKQLKNYANIEIIIVDTGSTDRTVEIAKQYTDKIYFEKWNNNFADMRNVSIKYCTGDWILILDADEVLYDVKELAKLINGKILDNFNSVFIKIINFTDNVEYSIENGSISPMMRLFKNDDIRYEGLVHEQPKYKEPILDSIVRFVHYGYDNSDSKLMEYKFNRNLKLLLEELKNEPENIYTNFQIATTYAMHNDFREGEKYIDIAYKLAKDELRKNIYVLDKYCLILYKLGKYEMLVEKSKDAINYCDDFLDFYFYLGTALYSLNKYKEASTAYEKYLELYYKENFKFDATMSISTKLYKNQLMCNLSTCYYKLEMYEKALETILSVKDKELIKSSALMIFRILIEGKLYNRFECINDFVDKYNYESILIYTERRVLLEDLEYISNLELKGRIEEIITVVKYFKINKNLNEILIEKIKNIIKIDRTPYSIYVYYLIKNDANIIKELITYGREKMQEVILGLCKLYYDFNEIMLENLNVLNSENLSECLVKIIMQRGILLSGNLAEDKKKDLFLNYIAERYYYILQVYRIEIIKEQKYILSDEDKFIFEIKNSLSLKYINKLEYIKKLKSILNVEKTYVDYIKFLVENNEEYNVDKSIKELIPQLLISINNLIKIEDYQKAYENIEEALSLVKFDFELMILKYNLLIMFNYTFEAEECLREIILYGDEDNVIGFISGDYEI